VQVAAEAGRAGVDVPRLLTQGQLGDRPVLIENAVQGSLADWLERWHRATAVRRPLSRARLVDALLRPAAELSADLQLGSDYLGWLETMAATAEGQEVAWVAAHNDLTMVNVLVLRGRTDGQQAQLGVIDWEDATESNLPLADFFYAAVDAAAATDDYADRAAAFAACFAPGGAWAGLVASYRDRLCRGLDIAEDVAALSFHACWLHYAARARQGPAGRETRHFLRIAQALAGHMLPAPQVGLSPAAITQRPGGARP
jgi:hypothetical protein